MYYDIMPRSLTPALISIWFGGAKRQDKMCRKCKPVLDSDWLLSHVVVAPGSLGSDERRSRSKISPLFIWIKESCVRKSEGLTRSKLLGILQTELVLFPRLSCPKVLSV